MRFAKQRFDIGLSTNNLEAMLPFWQNQVGARFDHLLKVRRGMDQHRHDLNGSVLKINHLADALPVTPPSGYVELLLARPGLAQPQALTDPDGNRVTLVPPGLLGVSQIGVRVLVRDGDAQRRFFETAFGLPAFQHEGLSGFRIGEGVVLVEQAADAPTEAPFEGKGWRYITVQVFAVDSDHAHVLAHGGREAVAPRTLGTTARISMVKDPAGNWIELSQRASIVGTLEPR
jgi:lactoylglutathione lyase